jgi:hypothetical protein
MVTNDGDHSSTLPLRWPKSPANRSTGISGRRVDLAKRLSGPSDDTRRHRHVA